MNNDAVIAALEGAIEKIREALGKLDQHRRNIGGPIAERTAKFNRISSRMVMLNQDITDLQFQLNERTSAREIAQAVAPLSNERRAALESGLAALSVSVAADGDFKAFLKFAKAITNAADGVLDASSIA